MQSEWRTPLGKKMAKGPLSNGWQSDQFFVDDASA
jgi:hypothetical protein